MTGRQLSRILALAMATMTMLMLGSCPLPPPPPPPPVADAGPDQIVAAGAEVTLDGSGSSSSNGGTLTFFWQQVSGTRVMLNNPQNVIATFVAPESSSVLTFRLSVTETPGGTARDTTQVTVVGIPPPTPAAILYVANLLGSNVTAYGFTFPVMLSGDVAPDADLVGFLTQLNAPSAAVIDNSGALLVNNAGTPAINGYADALDLTALNGNTPPNRIVQGAATGLVGAAPMAFDAVNDLLFVAETDTSVINVYADASTGFFNGDVPPVHSIFSLEVGNPRGINLDAFDELYVANGLGVDDVSVLAPASTVDGNVIATRVIQSPVFADLADAFVDARDTLYVVNGVGGRNRVDLFANAATLDGTFLPDATLTVVGAADISAIIVDSAGTGYIADPGNNAIYIYGNIVTRSGLVPPDATLQGPATGLAGPVRLFLEESP
jgi:hypothetical protein